MSVAAAMPTTAAERPVAGITLCVFGLFLFSLQDIIIKYFSDTYSVLQIVFTRGVVAVVPILAVMLITRGWRSMHTTQPKLLLIRGGLGFVSYLTYYMAIAALPLVEVVIIVFSAPILVTVMSAVVLKESVGVRRWAALLTGFVAIILVVGPSGNFKHLATVFAMLAAFAYATQNFLTRVISSGEPPWTITLYTMFSFIIGSIIAATLVTWLGAVFAPQSPSLQFLFRPWVAPPAVDGLLMAFLGLNAALAFYCMIRAYRMSSVSVIAPFEYTYIIWAVVFGYLIWAETPRTASIFGVALLIASGLYIFRRELQLNRAANGVDDADAAARARRRRRAWRRTSLRILRW